MYMKITIPPKLKSGDTVRVTTPARSLSMKWLNDEEMKDIAQKRFDEYDG